MSEDFNAPMELVTSIQPKKATESILALAGTLADSKTFSGDSVALIREIRDEW